MVKVLIHVFLFKNPSFVLYFDDFLKERSNWQDVIISNSLVGSVYVSGGAVDLELSSYVDVVDLRSGERSRGPSMRHPRLGHAAADSPVLFYFIFNSVFK